MDYSERAITGRVQAAAKLVLQDLDPEAKKRRQEFMSGKLLTRFYAPSGSTDTVDCPNRVRPAIGVFGPISFMRRTTKAGYFRPPSPILYFKLIFSELDSLYKFSYEET